MFCAYTRPRFQVSVYRTIGPLISYFAQNIDREYTLELSHSSGLDLFRCFWPLQFCFRINLPLINWQQRFYVKMAAASNC